MSPERLIWHCPEPCSAFGGHILRGHVQITYHQHSTLFDPFGGSDFFLNLEDRLQDHYGKDDSLCNIEGKNMVSLCEGCLGECMLSFDEDVQVFKCFSCLTWCDIPKKSLQKPRARTANSMNRPCEHGGINTCEH